MRVVVNTRMLITDRIDGIGRFSLEILKRITIANPETHFVFLFDREYDDEFIFSDNITPLVLSPKARHPLLYYYWFEFSVKSILNKMKPDVFFSPDGFLSLKADCKQIGVIHDINFFHYPDDLKWIYSKYYNYFFPRFSKRANHIFTVSEYSKSDIIKNYQLSPDKIEVIYNGVGEGFFQRGEEKNKATRLNFSKGCPYFLFVGSIHPRKNIPVLLKAFDLFKKQYGTDHKLLLCGQLFWGMSEIEIVFDKMEFNSDVIITGRVEEEKLQEIYSAAECLTYVPYFEGFGIPLAEAMASGIPIISSNTSCMPEVVGDAGLLVDPNNVEEIKNAMHRGISDNHLKKNLIQKGIERKKLFDWDKSAEKIWECMNLIVET